MPLLPPLRPRLPPLLERGAELRGAGEELRGILRMEPGELEPEERIEAGREKVPLLPLMPEPPLGEGLRSSVEPELRLPMAEPDMPTALGPRPELP